MRVAMTVFGLAILVLAVAWLKSPDTNPRENSLQSQVVSNELPQAEARRLAAEPTAAKAGREPALALASDFERELMNSEDRWELAQRLLLEARRGNGAAQYHLALTLSECQAFDDMYFDAGNRRRTVDEALQLAVKRGGLRWEYLAPIFKSCARLAEAGDAPFGNPEDWLHAAVASEYPRAMMQKAAEKAMKGRNTQDPIEAQALRDEARRLAMEAVRTKDSGAVAMMDSVTSWLEKNEASASGQDWVWLLAACQRGHDCSRDSAWYRFRCSYDPMCQPYENGVTDAVRRITGERYDDLQRTATEISRKLDEDRFDELGF